MINRILIVHPSKGRAKMACETAKKWIENASTFIDYCMVVESDEMEVYFDELESQEITGYIRLIDGNFGTAINAINSVCETHFKENHLLCVVSDDFSCCYMWNELLLSQIKGKSDFLVKTLDGIQKTLVTLPIMDYLYYKRFGYVYFGGFRHMFSDQEMTAVAHLLGKVIEVPLLFEHLHYTTGAMKMDKVNERNNSTWQQGERLFNERLKSNFGLKPEEIVKSYESIVWH